MISRVAHGLETDYYGSVELVLLQSHISQSFKRRSAQEVDDVHKT
jgi:hypothetical protein